MTGLGAQFGIGTYGLAPCRKVVLSGFRTRLPHIIHDGNWGPSSELGHTPLTLCGVLAPTWLGGWGYPLSNSDGPSHLIHFNGARFLGPYGKEKR